MKTLTVIMIMMKTLKTIAMTICETFAKCTLCGIFYVVSQIFGRPSWILSPTGSPNSITT